MGLIEDSVTIASHGREVVYDAEHFFDGYKADSSYALETIRAAERGGARIWFYVTPMAAHCPARWGVSSKT